jgi:hypothetical protein
MLYRKGARLGGVVVCALAVWVSACDGTKKANPTAPTAIGGHPAEPRAGGPPAAPQPAPQPSGPPPIVGSGSAVVVATGDTGWCGSPGVGLTARLVERLPGHIILAGDLAYMKGSAEDYRRCFDPEWGRLRSRFRPVPGNHEYQDPGANGYYSYFGDAAGPGRQGYYAFRAATWHVLMLNSATDMRRESAQWQWARSELQGNRTRCTLAVWHHPFASSGPNGLNGHVRDMWHLLNQHGAEVVVSGHDHFYERFAPQTEDYRYDPMGIRQFIAGTGGAPLYRPATRGPNTEAVVEAFGALKLTLNPSSYDWEFIEASSGRTIDRGSEACH